MVVRDFEGNFFMERASFAPTLRSSELDNQALVLQGSSEDKQWSHRMTKTGDPACTAWICKAYVDVIVPWSMTDPVGRPALFVDAKTKTVRMTRLGPGWFKAEKEAYMLVRDWRDGANGQSGAPYPQIVPICIPPEADHGKE